MTSAEFDETVRMLDQIVEALKRWDFETVNDIISYLHASDIAELISGLDEPERTALFDLLKDKLDPDMIAALSEELGDEFLDTISIQDMAKSCDEHKLNTVVALVSRLDPYRQLEFLRYLPAQYRDDIESILKLPKDSVAWIMHKDFITVPFEWTVGKSIDFIKKNQKIDVVYDIYVVDYRNNVLGAIGLKALLSLSQDDFIKHHINTDCKMLDLQATQQSAILMFSKYKVTSIPVTGIYGKMIGLVTIDDMLQIISKSAEKEVLKMSLVEHSDIYASVWHTSSARLKWLCITLVSSLTASSVISQFQGVLAKVVSLSILLPIAAAIGGNAGMQVVAITIRALATHDLRPSNALKIVFKEMKVGFINALIVSMLMGAISFFWLHDPRLSITLMCAIIVNICWAAVAGIGLPMLVSKMKMDPALSAGPMLTTSTDVIGFLSFLFCATKILL